MAALWRLLPLTRFWHNKLQKEIVCTPLLCDFGRLIETEEKYVNGFSVMDMLFTTVALYGSSLSEMTSESLFSVLTKKSVKTLILLEASFTDDISDRKTDTTDKRTTESKTNEEICHDSSKDGDSEKLPGEFDDIFSDCSDSNDSSSDESENEIDFSQEFKYFIEKLRKKKSLNKPDDKNSVEKLIIGAATFDRSYRLSSETTLHVHLLAVRKKCRKCGIGTWLIERMKDPDLVGPYDAIVTYADPTAIDFFTNNEFTDDVVLNSRYRKIDDNWLNSTPMCFIPHFAACKSYLRPNRATNDVSSIDIEELEKKLKEWQENTRNELLSKSDDMHHSDYKTAQDIAEYPLSCILNLPQVESQQKVIDRLKSENHKLQAKLKENENATPTSFEDEESRIAYEFVEHMMLETNILNVQVTSLKKASVSRSKFYAKLKTLKDPLMFTELYFCGGLSIKNLDSIMQNGFSIQDFCAASYGKGIYFSQSPRKAMEFSTPGSLLVCLVGLGNTFSLTKEEFSRTSAPVGCDSVLTVGRQCFGNKHVTGQEYVIYEENQAVPIYLINFEIEWANTT